MSAIIVVKGLLIVDEDNEARRIGMSIRGLEERILVVPLIGSVFPALYSELLGEDGLLRLSRPNRSGMVLCVNRCEWDCMPLEMETTTLRGETLKVVHKIVYQTKDGRYESLYFPSFEAGRRFCEAFREAAEDFYLNYPNYVKTIL